MLTNCDNTFVTIKHFVSLLSHYLLAESRKIGKHLVTEKTNFYMAKGVHSVYKKQTQAADLFQSAESDLLSDW
jgi:hypothetical protein